MPQGGAKMSRRRRLNCICKFTSRPSRQSSFVSGSVVDKRLILIIRLLAPTFGLKNCRDFRPSARFAIDKDLETRKVSERCPKIGTPMNQACVTS